MLKSRLNFRALTILFFLVGTQIGIVISSSAQANNVPVSQTNFQQLDLEHQRILVHDWMNQSQGVTLPTSFETKAIEFFKQHGQTIAIYQKYSGLFRPLYNENLHVLNRINFCNFLLNTFEEDEIPLQLIRTQKQILIELSTK